VESVTVGRRFNIKSLLAVADRGERFLLLALSQNHVRLFDVTRFAIKEDVQARLPACKRLALNYAGADRGEQVHTALHGSLGKQGAVFHGQGGEKDTAKAELEEYFHAIHRALEPVLNQRKVPLLLAGVDYLISIFRKTCSYRQLVEHHVSGNCDFLTEQQLRAQSWEIMRPYFDRPRQSAIEKLPALSALGRGSADVEQIATAAVAGKIDVLLADIDREQPGIWDGEFSRARLCGPFADGAEDLVNLAASETLLHGGTAFVVEPVDLTTPSPLAATFRY
jgi:hypothetical protein